MDFAHTCSTTYFNKRARGVPNSAADLWWASAYVRSAYASEGGWARAESREGGGGRSDFFTD